jgi:hypothetical protein
MRRWHALSNAHNVGDGGQESGGGRGGGARREDGSAGKDAEEEDNVDGARGRVQLEHERAHSAQEEPGERAGAPCTGAERVHPATRAAEEEVRLLAHRAPFGVGRDADQAKEARCVHAGVAQADFQHRIARVVVVAQEAGRHKTREGTARMFALAPPPPPSVR